MKTENKSFRVEGITCASCVRTVETALGKIDGVLDATVNFATERASVTYVSGVVGMPEFEAAVEDAGYHVAPEPALKDRASEKATFVVTGMSCASCANSVEKALQGIPGVISANVNYAAEKATVEYYPSKVGMLDFQREIEAAGYGVANAEVQAEGVTEHIVRGVAGGRELNTLWIKFLASGIAGAIVMALALLPLPIDRRLVFYISFVIATPIQFWAGWQFYRGAWASAKHLSANMNTLIAVGTAAAYIYSVVVTDAPPVIEAAGVRSERYYETAMVIVALILLGRFLEARAKARRPKP